MRHRLATTAAFAALVISCGQSGTGPATTDSSIEVVPTSFNPPTPVPTPNFVEEEQGTYYYVTAVSDEDRKKGAAVGKVLGYRYLGTNEKGQHIIASVSSNGRVIGKSFCSEPCAIIKYDDGDRIAYNPDSVIGSVFQDAMNGLLKPASQKIVADEPIYPRTVSSIPKAFQGAWDELTQDGCVDREARFVLDATKFYNFEVEWDVTKVDLISDSEMDLHTTAKEENGSQVNEIWQFKLEDGGKSLTSRRPGGTFFRRCPSS